MKDIRAYKNIYFLGIGGIGMSALARYFQYAGFIVGGYDKTPSALTHALEKEGISVHYEDLGPSIPAPFDQLSETLVIYTPAIPKNLGELLYLQHQEYTLIKRAEALGLITKNSKAIGVAGTHGKTTTSTLMAYLLDQSELKCSAFLGGISSNFNSNFLDGKGSEYTVIEADEFDRSFLHLHPFASIITSTDADHLDIYGDAGQVLEGFRKYAAQIHSDGMLMLRKGLDIQAPCSTQSYAINEDADFSGRNLRMVDGFFCMDVQGPSFVWEQVALGLPGIHNAENALACIGLAHFLQIEEQVVRDSLRNFKGVKRRFEYHLREEEMVFIDDYAHHPTEIHSLLESIKLLYPRERVCGVFQPHLFTRTRDFMDGFARELSLLDELILLPIYPAREEPISGINSEELLKQCHNTHKKVVEKEDLQQELSKSQATVFLSIGAGDIDREIPRIKEQLIELKAHRKI
ncbi:MAG: UDP-N-acetylmuramate--L-alanine ligase [Bacteroidetes bacterium]|nr:MAG: UDP-N-acetylmuramate--L-alanine ligase [Bacteroidota bacterium]